MERCFIRWPDDPVVDDARPCKLTAQGRAALVTQVVHNYTWGGGWLAPSEAALRPRPAPWRAGSRENGAIVEMSVAELKSRCRHGNFLGDSFRCDLCEKEYVEIRRQAFEIRTVERQAEVTKKEEK